MDVADEFSISYFSVFGYVGFAYGGDDVGSFYALICRSVFSYARWQEGGQIHLHLLCSRCLRLVFLGVSVGIPDFQNLQGRC